MRVNVNGDEHELEVGTTVAEVVTVLGRDPEGPGTAVAVNLEVVPRAAWSEVVLHDGDRVEVLAAIQGGVA